MWIVPKNEDLVDSLIATLEPAVAASRFRARILSWRYRSWRRAIKIETIRLRNRKPYCGQHPAECVASPFPKKHPTNTILEGLDWVGWNDGLNTYLDRLEIDADVFSYNRESFAKRYYVRRGRRRRVNYEAGWITRGDREFAHWLAGTAADFEDWCGRTAAQAQYEPGTPGFPCWSLAGEAHYRSLETVH